MRLGATLRNALRARDGIFIVTVFAAGLDRAERVGARVGRAAGDVLGELRLVLRLADLGEELHRQVLVRRALGDRIAIIVEQRLAEGR